MPPKVGRLDGKLGAAAPRDMPGDLVILRPDYDCSRVKHVWENVSTWFILQRLSTAKLRFTVRAASLQEVARAVKNPPVVQETRVWSLGGEDALGKRMATHSSVPAWRTPWTEEPGGLHTVHITKTSHQLT